MNMYASGLNYLRNLETLKSKIFRADGKFVSVTFPLKSGDIRRMTVKRASLERFVNPNADPVRAAAARNRDLDHPNLIRVFEFANSGQCRTLDLDKVLTVTCDGVTEHVIRRDIGLEFIKESRRHG